MPSTAGGLSGGAFPNSQPADRSATGLSYQSYSMNTKARGTNGTGQRVAPDPGSMFSPPMSGGQFGDGHAKSVVRFGGNPEEM